MSSVRCAAYNVGASSPVDFTAAGKAEWFDAKVKEDFAQFSTHGINLVFLCELDESHHNRARLPRGWTRIGAGEFQLAMAPGWTICSGTSGLRRVWPDAPEEHPRKGWRNYFQAGGSTGSSSRQQEAAGGSRRQHHQ